MSSPRMHVPAARTAGQAGRAARWSTAVLLGLLLIDLVPARAVCVGDCDNGNQVTIDELIRSVNIALALAPLAECLAVETNTDGKATINELIIAVNNALRGCPLAPTPADARSQPDPAGERGHRCDHRVRPAAGDARRHRQR